MSGYGSTMATEMTGRSRLAAGAVGGDEQSLNDVEKAAWLVEEAMVGRFNKDDMDHQTGARRSLYIKYENMSFPERAICALLLVAVSFLEIPGWCLHNRKGLFVWVSGVRICKAPGYVYLSEIDYLPVGVTALVEIVCVAYLVFLALLEARFEPRLTAKLKFRIGLVSVYTIDLVFFVVAILLGSSPWFRIAPYCRLGLFVVSFNAIYRSCHACLSLLPSFIDVFGLLALVVFFFSWLAAITFDDFRFENHEGVAVNDGFETFRAALYSTFMAATTADWPDPMLPSFVYRRFFGIFWFGFELLAVFLFLNLLLAVVYNEYSDFVKEAYCSNMANRAKGLAAAFKLLAQADETKGEKCITKQRFAALVAETNKVERVPSVTPGTLEWFFSIMDDDNSGAISATEFYDVCDILQYSFRRICTKTWAELYYPAIANHPFYAMIKRHAWETNTLQRTVNAVLFVNVLLVLFQSYQDLENVETEQEENAWGYVEFIFSLFYASALALELLVTPFDEFWLHPANRFDFFVTLILLLVAIYWVSPFTSLSPDLLHYLVILRLLRLVNLIANLERFRFIGSCIAKIVPASGGVLGILFACASLWASFGVQFFGGLVYDYNPDLQGTDYIDAHYQILNFNDFAISFLPLFAMITSGGPCVSLL